MAASINWDALYAQYLATLPRIDRPIPAILRTAFTEPYVHLFAHPTQEDADWLIWALRQPQHKWFLVGFIKTAPSVADVLFAPILNAGVDEVDPSGNRDFIEPCIRLFGRRRVVEFLLDVLEKGTDFRKAGAVNALYWTHVPLMFPADAPTYELKYATPESRLEYEALADLRKRWDTLLLRTFVSNANVDVRRSIVAALNLCDADYEPPDRPLIAAAIAIARADDDPYIRHRIAVQLGESRVFRALPHREPPT